ncbi:MAG: hypothetical protein QQW96_14485 [Tychonema bourrellyi B0820]|nr:hypothetical protein [Tychonema bourrellyi]MDQ2098845.1 hypothetical protein [Tychonema bourrellyi B0820]
MSSFLVIRAVAIANIEATIAVDLPLILTFERLPAVENLIMLLA